MKKTQFYLLLLMIVFSVPSFSQLNYTIKFFGHEDGLSQGTISEILCDNDNYLWFTTWNGICKYNGYKIENFRSLPGDKNDLNTNRIDYAKFDKGNTLWFLDDHNKLFFFDNNKKRLSSLNGRAISAKKIYIQPDSTIFIREINNDITEIKKNKEKIYYKTIIKGNVDKSKIIGIRNIDQRIWILTKESLYKYDKTKNKIQKVSILKGSNFHSFREYNNKLLIGTDNGKLLLYSPSTKHIKIYKFNSNNPVDIKRCGNKSFIILIKDLGMYFYDENKPFSHYNKNKFLISNDIQNIFVDKQNIWITYSFSNIITCFNKNSLKTNHYNIEIKNSIKENIIFHQDSNGIIWIYTKDGFLNYYNQSNNNFEPLITIKNNKEKRLKAKKLFNDPQGNLWIAEFPKGLVKLTFKRKWSKCYKPLNGISEGDEVRSIIEDTKGNIWSGTRFGYIYINNKDGDFMGYINNQGEMTAKPFSFNSTISLLLDDDKNIWFGTREDGIYRLIPKSDYKYTIKHYNKEHNGLSSNNIFTLAQYKHGKIWVGTKENGLDFIEKKSDDNIKAIKGTSYLTKYPITEYNSIKKITFDSKGNAWLSTSNGILFCKVKRNIITYYPIFRESNRKNSLCCNNTFDVFCDKNDNIYATSFGGGLEKFVRFNNKKQAEFDDYSSRFSISTVPFSAIKDKHGNMWIPSEDGLYLLKNGNNIYLDERFFSSDIQFSEARAIYTSNDKICLASNIGTIYFNPNDIKLDTTNIKVVFNKLFVNNKSKLFKSFPYDNILTNKENSFSITFTSLDYRYPEKTKFAYRLKGFDDWNYVYNSRIAIYNNIPKGDYVFEVKATNSDDIWNTKIEKMNITILPSFWESNWGYFLYIMIFIAIIILSSYILITIYKLRTKVKIEKKIIDIKNKFFTDIIHELRTPFTLIVAPVEYLLKNCQLNTEVRQDMEIVQRNTNHTLKIINQVLDLEKIQSEKMKLTVSHIELGSFCKHIITCFQSLAIERECELTLTEPKNPIYIWADADKLESMLYNIIGNAFKYSPKASDINISIVENDDSVDIRIQDHGYGIDSEKQKSIYNRFENYVTSDIFKKQSSGIGLALVKELMELHHGKIKLESKVNEGSTFTLCFLKGKSHFKESTEFSLDDFKIEDGIEPHKDEEDEYIPDKENDDTLSILIVDDNHELCNFLKAVLSDSYRVITAANGKEGLEKAISYLPDIIVSDIVMPIMNGIDMVKQIHNTAEICHTPIVLLSSKASVESMNEGLSLGVDDYITKPFSANYLKAKILNILRKRRELQDLYRHEIIQEISANESNIIVNDNQASKLESNNKIPEIDRQIIVNVEKYINDNINDVSMNLDKLASIACLSRSALYKKFKCYLGVSPTDLIRDIRLKKAAKLIDEKELNFTEIAEQIGFKDIQYFSRCFKQLYGMTPTDYRNR